jgi:hypothetical protein
MIMMILADGSPARETRHIGIPSVNQTARRPPPAASVTVTAHTHVDVRDLHTVTTDMQVAWPLRERTRRTATKVQTRTNAPST